MKILLFIDRTDTILLILDFYLSLCLYNLCSSLLAHSLDTDSIRYLPSRKQGNVVDSISLLTFHSSIPMIVSISAHL